jgi:hypothetical protein
MRVKFYEGGGTSSSQTELDEQTTQMTGGSSAAGGMGAMNFAAIGQVARGSLDMITDATGKQKNDTMDSVYDAASDVAMQFGPWGMLAAGVIDTWNFADKMFGQEVKGFHGDTGIQGYNDFTVDDKNVRLTQLGSLQKARQYRNAMMDQYTEAATNVQINKLALDARTQAGYNAGFRNQAALAGGIDTSVLMGKEGLRLRHLKDFIKTYKR